MRSLELATGEYLCKSVTEKDSEGMYQYCGVVF